MWVVIIMIINISMVLTTAAATTTTTAEQEEELCIFFKGIHLFQISLWWIYQKDNRNFKLQTKRVSAVFFGSLRLLSCPASHCDNGNDNDNAHCYCDSKWCKWYWWWFNDYNDYEFRKMFWRLRWWWLCFWSKIGSGTSTGAQPPLLPEKPPAPLIRLPLKSSSLFIAAENFRLCTVYIL